RMVALDAFQDPIRSPDAGNAWDFHIYYRMEDQFEYAKELYQRVHAEFPTCKIFRLWDHPIGPHTLPFFEVDVFTTQEFGAFLSWIAFHRRGLSVLVHPHSVPADPVADHAVHGFWLGEKLPLKLEFL
ncbi:DOPA-like domain-containing protein, partial [Zopfochytrium polystomum]